MNKMRIGLLSYSVVNDCCKLQRTEWPLVYLHNIGKIELNIGYLSMIPMMAFNKEKRDEFLENIDTLIIQRPTMAMHTIELFLDYIEKDYPNVSVIFEFDDWLWEHDEILKFSDVLSKYPIICSTQVLAKNLALHMANPKIFVWPTKLIALDNYYDNDFSSCSILHTGTRTHLIDLEQNGTVMKNFLINHGDAEFLFWGNFAPKEIREFKSRYKLLDFISDYYLFQDQFMKLPCRFGVNPLAPTRKNWCKSGIKYLEYGLKGVPALYEDMPEYRRLIPKEFEFLLCTENDFAEKLELLYTMPKDMLKEIGENLRQDVIKNHLLNDEILQKYYDLIEKCNELNLQG